MLIEQTIELQLKGPGSLGRTCTPIIGYFHDKTKTSKENLRVDSSSSFSSFLIARFSVRVAGAVAQD